MDHEFLEELFAPFGVVTLRKMFGGTGIFYRGLNFAAVMDGVLRLKADESTFAEFEAEGMEPWTYTRKDGTAQIMNYWQVPDRLLDEPQEFALWAERAFDVAVRADAVKPPKQRKLKEI
ncbi:MAG: TfoX/Sxy family protein [Ahrensia sp.]|nr:TfoX/Sxy family protein [Ahrensia sp.]